MEALSADCARGSAPAHLARRGLGGCPDSYLAFKTARAPGDLELFLLMTAVLPIPCAI